MRLFLVIFAVEALAASWIEILLQELMLLPAYVEALAASWIEIDTIKKVSSRFMSKPLRLRGLKSSKPILSKALLIRRSPCGFVD